MIKPNQYKSRRFWGSSFVSQSRGRQGLATVLAVVFVGASAAFFAPRGVQAATYTMTASDTGTGTSFNTAGHWNAGGAPSAGNSYFTSTFDLRTPTTAGGSTFAGSSLEIDSGAPNGFIMKQSSGSANTIVVNNLIFNGGQLYNGNAASDNEFLSGTATITANSTVTAGGDNTRTITLGSTLAGGANLTNLNGTLILTATNSAFTGKFGVSGGTLQIGDGATSPGSPGAVNIGNSGTVAFATPAGFSFVYSGAMSGSGSLAMKGRGISSCPARIATTALRQSAPARCNWGRRRNWVPRRRQRDYR